MHRWELDGCEKVLGKDHPDTLGSVSNLASVLRSQGKYGEAGAMSRRALDGMEKMLGKEHPHTLRSTNNLALVLADQGKYEEAELMNRRALDGMEKMLGKEHPHTLRSASNLALMLVDRGKYEEAEAINRRALDEKLSQMVTPKQRANVSDSPLNQVPEDNRDQNGGVSFYNYGKIACQVACQVSSWYIHGDVIY
jgi:tetratricopeptide (TPR) repeat protein